MRSTSDRIRQALAFELIGLAIVVPFGVLFTGIDAGDFGVVAIFASVAATGWNYLYNLGFDRVLLRLRGRADKTLALRVVHALGFEGGLLVILLPPFAWYLEISLLAALAMELSFAVFYVVYAFVFTWAYDAVYPVPSAAGER